MGDTLDFVDREIFELYQDIEGYKYAQLFLRDKKYLVSKITYLNNGILSDTVLIDDISKFSELNYNLSRFEIENDKKFESPLDASVFTNAGNNYDGKLEMFSKRHLFLYSDLNYLTGNSSPFNYKVPVSRTDSLMISVKPSLGPYIGYGALGGVGLGLAAALFWINTANLREGYEIYVVGTTTLVGAAVGVLVGWIIGETVPPDIINIQFNMPYDITKLRNHSAYYFRYEDSLEQRYIEIE